MSSTDIFVPKKLLIVGATGLIGKRITNAIVNNKTKFDRIVVFTSPNTVKTKTDLISSLQKEGVEIIEGDVNNPDDIKRAYQGIDTVISAVGRDAIETQIDLIRVADSTPNIRRFFPSEYGTDIEYGPSSINEKPHQKKLKVRTALRQASDLEHTFLVTGPYADGDRGLYFSASPLKDAGTFDVKKKFANLLGDGEGRVSFTTMRDVGKLLVLALLHPEASRNKALRVNSFTATDKEILREFEKQTGGEPWEVKYTPLDELRKLEKEAWESGTGFPTGYTLRRIWAEGGTLYDQRDNHLIEGDDVVDSLADAVAEAIRVQNAA